VRRLLLMGMCLLIKNAQAMPMGTTVKNPVAAWNMREPLREGSAATAGMPILAAVALAVTTAAGSCGIKSKRARSPLREGSAALVVARVTTVSTAPLTTVTEAASSSQKGIGVDTLSVKRANAPEVKARTVGNFAKARMAISSKMAAKLAVDGLRSDVYAKTSKDPRQRKLRTLEKLGKAADPPFALLPLTRESLEVLAAALKSGGYRTGGAYLQIAKKEHILAGHTWSMALGVSLRDAERSIIRGIGPPQHATDFKLEELAQMDSEAEPKKDGPIRPVDVGICMALWMLRGIEAASLLGEQVQINAMRTAAAIDLGPTKEDVEGRGVRRTLLCACCPENKGTGMKDACPVHALARVMDARAKLSLTEKHPLFPQKSGEASTAKGVYTTFSSLVGANVTEHSFRRAGAQYYARRGVAVVIIQFIGRWGSATVYRYIDEALDTSARHAARTAASFAPLPVHPTAITSRTDSAALILKELDNAGKGMEVVNAIVDRAVKAAQTAVEEGCKELELKFSTIASKSVGAVKPVGRAAARAQIHVIALGDTCYTTDLWTTACGWRFGNSPHVRVSMNEVSCASCIRYAIRVMSEQ
jgi:hypothetical protein